MKYLKYGLMVGLLVFFAGYASNTDAQVAVRVGPVGFGVAPGPVYVGPPPACAYGYYGYYPYACAPYGYYGPAYFSGGVFIGAGPWFHGFYGPGGRGFYGRGWYGDRDGWHSFRGEGGWHRGEGFHGGAGFHGDFHGGNSFHGGGGFHGSNGGFHGSGGSHGGGGFHGGGHR